VLWEPALNTPKIATIQHSALLRDFHFTSEAAGRLKLKFQHAQGDFCQVNYLFQKGKGQKCSGGARG